AEIGRNPRLVRSFFRHPSVSYITDLRVTNAMRQNLAEFSSIERNAQQVPDEREVLSVLLGKACPRLRS
ncbi:hypothetical protein J8I87_42035, partial [Paraburkholderia sp. LEh10]|uniref:hypothetical protein n=1 Tax=Paraburkholderia sp. LEh10 TaxID=2821353 RepID=UPI001AE18932